jgi:hypothetical protein
MKKGFTLILLLVATVIALGVAPALATAPPVGNLPRIVFGDSGEIQNAFDLDAYIDWYGIRTTGTMAFNLGVDPYDPEEGFHVYLSDGVTGPAPVVAWDTTVTQPISTKLDATDLGNLAIPMLPFVNETDKNIYRDNGRHWLSLTNDGVAGLTTIYLGAYVKSDITTGAIQSFQAVAVAGAPSMVQYGRDFSSFGYGTFENWDMEGRAGPGFFGAQPAAGVSSTFMAWDASVTFDSQAVAFGVALASLPGAEGGYPIFIPYDGGVGLVRPVFEAKALMRNDTTQADYRFAPGFRLEIINGAQTHIANMQNQMTENLNITPPNGPYSGNQYAFTGRTYWETPMGMSQMADGEALGDYLATGNATDGRDYGIAWDVIDSPNPVSGGNDQGIFQLVALSIRIYEGAAGGDLVYTPYLSADGATPAAWDAAEIGEWDLKCKGMAGFNPGVVQGVNGTVHGSGVPTGDALVDGLRIWAHDVDLEPLSHSSLRFQMAVPDTFNIRNRVPLVPDTLLCATITVMSEDIETAPGIRMFQSHQGWNGGAPIFRQISWEQIWGPAGPAYKNPNLPRPVDGLGNPIPAPGVPLVTGTTLRAYLWTHKAPVPAVGEFTVPELQIFSLGMYGPHALNDWTDETGFLEFRGITYSSVQTDQSGEGPLAIPLNPLYSPPAIP